jgi:phage anti-repressor protein
MTDLIKVEERDGIETVNARELHEFLEVKDKFATWITRRIEKYDFVAGQDFTVVSQNCVSGNNAVSKEYYISIDMAKELSMVENNERGREARMYFIAREKQAKQLESKMKLPNFNNPAEAARAWANMYEQKTIAVNEYKKSEKKVIKLAGGVETM